MYIFVFADFTIRSPLSPIEQPLTIIVKTTVYELVILSVMLGFRVARKDFTSSTQQRGMTCTLF